MPFLSAIARSDSDVSRFFEIRPQHAQAHELGIAEGSAELDAAFESAQVQNAQFHAPFFPPDNQSSLHDLSSNSSDRSADESVAAKPAAFKKAPVLQPGTGSKRASTDLPSKSQHRLPETLGDAQVSPATVRSRHQRATVSKSITSSRHVFFSQKHSSSTKTSSSRKERGVSNRLVDYGGSNSPVDGLSSIVNVKNRQPVEQPATPSRAGTARNNTLTINAPTANTTYPDQLVVAPRRSRRSPRQTDPLPQSAEMVLFGSASLQSLPPPSPISPPNNEIVLHGTASRQGLQNSSSILPSLPATPKAGITDTAACTASNSLTPSDASEQTGYATSIDDTDAWSTRSESRLCSRSGRSSYSSTPSTPRRPRAGSSGDSSRRASYQEYKNTVYQESREWLKADHLTESELDELMRSLEEEDTTRPLQAPDNHEHLRRTLERHALGRHRRRLLPFRLYGILDLDLLRMWVSRNLHLYETPFPPGYQRQYHDLDNQTVAESVFSPDGSSIED